MKKQTETTAKVEQTPRPLSAIIDADTEQAAKVSEEVF